MPYALASTAAQALLVNELSALVESQRAGRDVLPPEAVAADIIDRVLRKQLPREPQTIEGHPL